MSKNILVSAVTALALVFGGLSTVGCAAGPEEAAPQEKDDLATTAEPLASNGGGPLGYECTDSGYCQCSGLEDCNNMFHVCKAFQYCNQDPTGHINCCCWNFEPLRTKPGRITTPVGGIGAAAN